METVAAPVSEISYASIGARDAAWNERFRQLREVTLRLGRLPRSANECGTALLAWAVNQRRALDLTDDRRVRLETLPGWDWEPRQSQWEARAEELRLFIAHHSRTPRVRADAATEKALAHWYSRQRRAQDEQRLSGGRSSLLDYATKDLHR